MPFKIKHFDDFCQTGGGAKDDKAIAFQSSPDVDVYDRQSTCGGFEYPRIYFEECVWTAFYFKAFHFAFNLLLY